MAEMKIGDVVRLKSGGPAMTVTDAQPDARGKIVIMARWYVHPEFKHAAFHPDTLQEWTADK